MKKESERYFSRQGQQTIHRDVHGRTIVDDGTNVPTTAPPPRPRLDLGSNLTMLLLMNSLQQGALFRGFSVIGVG